MIYTLNPNTTELIDDSFISRIEPILANHNNNKVNSLKEIEYCKNSLVSKLSARLEVLWQGKLNENKKFLETIPASIDSLLTDSESKNVLSDSQKKYYIKFLKASMIYLIKEEEKISKDFKINDHNNFKYAIEPLREDSNPFSIIKYLDKTYSLNEIDEFINHSISQLATIHPEYESFVNKDADLEKKFVAELSKFCSPLGFYEPIYAKVVDCEVTKNLDKRLNLKGIKVDKEVVNFPEKSCTPGTILSINHPIIKTLIIRNYGIPVSAESEVEFDVDLSFPLKNVINDPFETRQTFSNLNLPGFHTERVYVITKFDSLFAKRKPEMLEFVHNYVKLPGNVKFVYDYY